MVSRPPRVERRIVLLCVNVTVERPFACIATNLIPNLVATAGFGSATYCFPLYTYRDERQRSARTTFRSLRSQHFQKHYRDKAITRKDIFHYVYALLHHPRLPAALRREPQARVATHSALRQGGRFSRLRRSRPEADRPARELRAAEAVSGLSTSRIPSRRSTGASRR